MFPLQRYPPMAPPPPPPPPNPTPIAPPGSRNVSQSEPHSRRAVVSPYQQFFPLRIAQANSKAMASSSGSLALGHDYQLRRKTPNGTIDAGYDGSPTQLCQGPPPFKQMVLPIPSVANLAPGPSHNGPAIQHYGPLDSPFLKGTDDHSLDTTPWLPRNGQVGSDVFFNQGLPPSHLLGQSWQQGGSLSQGQTLSFYQPLMRAYEYNVRAFCPPPVPMAEASAFGQFNWQTDSVVRDPRLPEQFGRTIFGQADSRGTGNISRYGFPASPSHHGAAAVNPASAQDIAQSSNLDLQSLRLDSDMNTAYHAHSKQYAAQVSFKEKALSFAHRHYIDLLSYLQSMRRASQISKDSGQIASSEPLVYPKAPKLRCGRSSVAQDYRDGNGQPDDGSTFPSPNDQASSSMGSIQGFVEERDFLTKQRSYVGHRDYTTSMAHQAPLPSKMRGAPLSIDSVSRTMFSGKPTPAVNAKNSLEVLRSLCEQSNWEWIDGILLGGCLHYGLGHFEGALKWFSRVVALDSSHVEAITNMAATLYCLGRQDEAERHWLMAIKLCPSHLDAAEHLVGLLYRKRNHDAIEVICYIQQALRLVIEDMTEQRQQMPSAESASTTALFRNHVHCPSRQITNESQKSRGGSFENVEPGDSGFGSSGYALPGSDNGRILALIHAKGTMLYSLKDIRKASEAFEEAVLISVGRHIRSVQDLVQQIHAVLLLDACLQAPNSPQTTPLHAFMLPPEKARKTAHLVFSRNGELPGLCLVPDGAAKRAAIQTTSNALLSLAKIYQDAMSSGNIDIGLIQHSSGIGDILALYYLSLSLQESPSTANNVGILLAGVQQAVVGAPHVSSTLPPQPNLPDIASGSGLALALAYYNYGLRLDPNHVHLHTNLGSLLKDVGQLDLAIQMYEKAVSCDGTFDIALTNLANAVKDKGRIKDAISYYKRAVEANPAFSEAVCGLFTALNSVCDWRGRGGVFLDFGRYDRWHVDEIGALQDVRTTMRGSGLTKRVVGIVCQQLGEVSQWGSHILRQSNMRLILSQLQRLCTTKGFELDNALKGWTGKPWEGARFVRLLERATRVMQWTWYHDQHVLGRKAVFAHYPRPRLPPSLSVPSAPTVLPFHTFTCPLSAKDIRKISQSNAIRISCSTLRSSWLPSTIYPPPPPPNPHLNIGYVSSDFNNHPLAHLMQSVFGFHDPRRVRAFCYATTPSDRSTHRQQIEREAPVFRDVSTWSPSRFLEQILADKIHILVNLNGYTRGARNEIFAARPAPIQMSFMGFAGTLGAEWCDYILADTTAIPPETLRPWRSNVAMDDVFQDLSEGDEPDWMYSENIIFCRDTFFCCDHAQSSTGDERAISWEEEQRRRWTMRKELFPSLPDDAIILANFNQLYKIEPTTFRSWLRILARIPKAVLWLLKFPDLGESNLRHTAELWAGPEVASRVIFTDVAAKNLHISRARVCDLFLDTPECNAHTTAADVLWSSTPLLTLPRYPYKMCSRMAASILRGALPKSAEGQRAARDLIANNEAEYEESAETLAGGLSYTTSAGFGEGRGRLAEIRKLLWESKWQCALFDTRRWVDDVEEAYDEAWRRWVKGEAGDIYL